MNPAIEALLRPRSIEIVGASNLQKLYARTPKALLDKGYEGKFTRSIPNTPQECRVSQSTGDPR